VAVIEAEKKPFALYTGFKQKWLGRWVPFCRMEIERTKGMTNSRIAWRQGISTISGTNIKIVTELQIRSLKKHARALARRAC
jgi:hypothetical protein